MTRKTIFLLAIVGLLFFTQTATAQTKDLWIYGDLELGLELSYSRLKIPSSAVPEAVQQEAANPSIYHHRSGNTFYKDKIGTFSPGEKFSAWEGRLHLRLLLTEWRLRPFIEIGIVGGGSDISTNDGTYNKGYSYFRLLGHSGVDYIGYWYGIDYDLDIFSPAVGLAYDISDKFRLIGRVQQQKLELTYQKGREAYGSPEGRITLASEEYDIYTYSLIFEFGNEDVAFTIGPSYTNASNGMEGGFSGLISFTIRWDWKWWIN